MAAVASGSCRMAISTTTCSLVWRLLLLSVFSTIVFPRNSVALQVVPGSPCESRCSDTAVGSLNNDVRCLDTQFVDGPGLAFKDCISCELNSTTVQSGTDNTDVLWALFNLRYSLSSCMFGYPTERVSISSPCQVTCASLQSSVIAGISADPNATTFTSDLGFCNSAQFDDTIINYCASCYSLIPEQVFLGNFLQALHIACRSPPIPGRTFYPDADAIFINKTIAGPTGPKPPPPPKAHLHGYKLILVIVLPIVGFLFILGAVCFCCWHFTRRRRQSMAASGRMSKFHDGHASDATYSPVGSGIVSEGKWHEPPREMERIQVVPKTSQPASNSPGLAQGRWSHVPEEVPLNSADREAFAMQRQDSHLHEQFIGTAQSPDTHNERSFRAQDGFVQDH